MNLLFSKVVGRSRLVEAMRAIEMKCRRDHRPDTDPTCPPRPQPAQSAASTSDSDTTAMAHAYNSTLTLDELQSSLSASKSAREALGKQLSEALNHTRSLGHLSGGAAWGLQRAEEEEDALSACLMGRLNPRVFGRRGRADEGRQRRLGRNVGGSCGCKGGLILVQPRIFKQQHSEVG